MKKTILIIVILILIIVGLCFAFREKIATFIYENKYAKIECINEDLTYNKETNTLSENSVSVGDFNIVLSNLQYTNENELNFELKFSNSNSLNHVGYILRVFNEEYYLGDRFNGQTSISSQDWVMYSNIFYKNIFKENFEEKNLLNNTQFSNQNEVLESGELIHKISFKLPEQFVIGEKLNIDLFDINYQNIGDTNFYKLKEPLSEINFIINYK